METISVLLQNHRLSGGLHGGDLVQLEETRGHLQALGVETEVSSNPRANLSGFDLVHIFNALESERSYAFARNAVAERVPYVVSSVYWDPSRYLLEGFPFTSCDPIDRVVASVVFRRLSLEKLSALKHRLQWRGGLESQPGLEQARTEILRNASRILPNSEAEGKLLVANFPIQSEKVFVVYNAVEPSFAEGNPDLFRSQYSLDRDFVLSCARLEPRKNTLRLIDACLAERFPLVIMGYGAGAGDPLSNRLYRHMALRRSRRGDVVVIPSQEYGSPIHRGAYAAAAVHALPSWFETPGLASLEAAAAGCHIVTTSEGSASEYFGTLANYCDPGVIGTIRQALRAAWSVRNRATALRQHVLSRYTWNKAAEATLTAYKQALSDT